MKYIVDRIEEGIAVLENTEDGKMTNLDLSEIPFEIKEGDVIIYENDEWSNSAEEKEDRLKEIRDLMNDVWN